MKTKLLFTCILLFAMSHSFAQVILYEPFNYSDGQSLIGQSLTGVGTWTNIGTTPDDMLITLQPNWDEFGLPIPSGNAVKYQGSGSKLLLNFPEVTSGTIYYSFLMNVIDWAGFTPEAYRQIHLTINAAGNAGACLFFKAGTEADTFNIGYSPSDTVSEAVYAATNYAYETEYLFVISYEIGTSVGKLWINPAVSSTEPAADLSTAVTAKPRASFNGISIHQSSNARTPNSIIDEIRVAKSWPEVLGLPALNVSKNEIEGLKIYPNPAKDYITIESKNVKLTSVELYNVLGSKILSQKALTNNRLNISGVSKGIYMLKVNAEGASTTKKLVIE